VAAGDLQNVDFACYYRPDSLIPVMMTPLYSGDKTTLYLKPQQAVKFSDIENIYYGSQQNGDLNLCGTNGNNSNIFNYQIIHSTNPNYP
jgi:cytochrome bd-type quinol oxidase subunit 1